MSEAITVASITSTEAVDQKEAPTVSDHAGLVSVELDHFCDFGAELNFFVKLQRTISAVIIRIRADPSTFRS